jgi:hypothetical protein
MAYAKNGKNKKKSTPPLLSQLTPQQIAVIAGLLADALSVDSVLVDKDQNLQIVLTGSLRRRSKLDQLLSELEDTSLGEIFDALSNR